MEYDAEIQVSIGEYEFIKICHSAETIEALVGLAREVQNQVRGGEGISDADFRLCLDSMLAGTSVPNGVELWEKMSTNQRMVCQEFKKAMKRMNYKNNKETV